MKTAADLISRSISHDETTHAEWSAEVAAGLVAACDDHVRSGDVVEFWGEDDGGDWRVHLDIEPAVRSLRDAAAAHGDEDMVDDCERALDGDSGALARCYDALRAAMG